MQASSPFDRYNRTELYQACRSAGIVCLPNEPREKYVAYLEGEAEPDDANQVFDRWRHGIMGFVLEYWKKLEAQLKCPAKSGDPLACFSCVDAQVISCVVDAKPHENLIRIHLPNGETRP